MANNLLMDLANEMSETLEEQNRLNHAPSDLKTPITREQQIPTDDGFEYSDEYIIDTHYRDTAYSIINNNKTISLDNGQINLTQEQNSQVVPFKIPRYWDGIDLTEMRFYIHFFNASNKEGAARPINVKCDEDYIYFMWLINSAITKTPGTITFEIIATGTHNSLKYIWRTQASSGITVLKGLDIGNANDMDSDLDSDEKWYDSFINELDTIVSNFSTAAGEIDLTDYATKEYVNSQINDLDIYIGNGSYNAESKKIILSFNKDGKDKIEIPIGDLINGLASSSDLDNYYTKEEIGDIPKTEDDTNQTLVEYINAKTTRNLEYLTEQDMIDYVGELPDNVNTEKVKTIADYIGTMGDGFYKWIIDMTIPSDVQQTNKDGAKDSYTYKTFSFDGSEFFSNRKLQGFNLYADINLEDGLTVNHTFEEALAKLQGKEEVSEEDINAILDLPNIELISKYNEYKDIFDKHYIKINLHNLSADAQNAVKYYYITAPNIITQDTNIKDILYLKEVPVRKQYFASSDTIVEYVDKLSEKIDKANENSTLSHNELKNLILDNSGSIVNIGEQVTIINGDKDTEGSIAYAIDQFNTELNIDEKLSKNVLTDKIGDYYTTPDDVEAYGYAVASDVENTYATKEYVGTIPDSATAKDVVQYIQETVDKVDVSDQLKDYAEKSTIGTIPIDVPEDANIKTIVDYIDYKVSSLDIITPDELINYLDMEEKGVADGGQ